MDLSPIKIIFEAILGAKLISGTFSSPRDKNNETPKKMVVRQISVKGKIAYQLSEHYKENVLHKNWNQEQTTDILKEAFQKYTQADILLTDCHYHLLINKHNQITVIKKDTPINNEIKNHNKQKNYILNEERAIPFLVTTGIMTPEGKIHAKKFNKFKQINRFLEMIDDIYDALPKNGVLNVIDFGCGKAHLTFALYHYLDVIKQRKLKITGLDLKKEVIESCQKIASELNYEDLSFAVGDINEFETKEEIDLVVCLHACNTATDAALEKAVRWNSRVILCVPCCQHELYTQIKSPSLTSLFRHGILKERIAALATDAARAEILTMLGYDVQIIEFIDLEHTPKNLLIRATKGVSEEKQKQAKERYFEFKTALNISPSLETRFSKEFILPP